MPPAHWRHTGEQRAKGQYTQQTGLDAEQQELVVWLGATDAAHMFVRKGFFH